MTRSVIVEIWRGVNYVIVNTAPKHWHICEVGCSVDYAKVRIDFVADQTIPPKVSPVRESEY